VAITIEVHAVQLGEGFIDALLAIGTNHRLVEIEQRVG
jgi:hypothetical protein